MIIATSNDATRMRIVGGAVLDQSNESGLGRSLVISGVAQSQSATTLRVVC